MGDVSVYGLHAVHALLTNRARSVRKLSINQSRLDERMQTLVTLAKAQHIPIDYVTSEVMKRRFAGYVHQGVVAEATSLPEYTEQDIETLMAETPCLILILDGITDPHNLGACLRTAEAAGVDFVLIPKDKNASITPAVSKVACGAAESVPLVRVTNLARAMQRLKKMGVWMYGAAGEAKTSLYTLDCQGSIAFIMGAESRGLRRLTREHCDVLFALPMSGVVTSLNVSVAAGLCLYEAVRQRTVLVN